MDQTDKLANDKITKLENEIKVLKNEVQAVLLDLRESYLNMGNPFNSVADPATIQPIVINTNNPPRPEETAAVNHKSDPVRLEGKPFPESKVQPDPDLESARREIQTVSDANPVHKSTSDKQDDLPTHKNGKLDILTVAGLVNWVEEATQKLGKERSIAVLEMSQAMGYLADETKPIMVNLIGLAEDSTIVHIPRHKIFLDALIKLNRLLSHGNLEQIAMELLIMESGETNG
jgi:hypothetical protein